MLILVFGILCVISALYILYLKYRIVFTGEKCKGKIVDIADMNGGFTVGGVSVKKHAYIVQIKNRNYYTAHGCIFVSLGKRNIGKEIFVYKNENYGQEVFKCFDFRIEMVAFLMLLMGIFCMYIYKELI